MDIKLNSKGKATDIYQSPALYIKIPKITDINIAKIPLPFALLNRFFYFEHIQYPKPVDP